MIYKTIIDNADLANRNQAHKKVHKVMHDSDEHVACPPFFVSGDTITVQSSTKPKMAGVATTELAMPTEGKPVRLKVLLAAVKRSDKRMLLAFTGGTEVNGKIKNGRLDEAYMVSYLTNRFAEFGLTQAGHIACSYKGALEDPNHNVRKFPICELDGCWNFSSTEQLEKLLLTKVGRLNYLGLGMVRIVPQW